MVEPRRLFVCLFWQHLGAQYRTNPCHFASFQVITGAMVPLMKDHEHVVCGWEKGVGKSGYMDSVAESLPVHLKRSQHC